MGKSERGITMKKPSVGVSLFLVCAAFVMAYNLTAMADESQKGKISMDMVEQNITKGTQQTEVVKLLGKPDSVGKNNQGEETWVYKNKVSNIPITTNMLNTGILGGRQDNLDAVRKDTPVASSNKSIKSLFTITFDDKNMVKTYRLEGSGSFKNGEAIRF